MKIIQTSDFFKPKIVYGEIVQYPQFFYDDKRYFPEATTFLLVGNNLPTMLAFLNSKLLFFAFKKFYMGGELGDKGVRYKKAFLEKLPIPITQDKELEESVKKILEITSKKDYPNESLEKEKLKLEHFIDKKIYQIYSLTKKEIQEIELSLS